MCCKIAVGWSLFSQTNSFRCSWWDENNKYLLYMWSSAKNIVTIQKMSLYRLMYYLLYLPLYILRIDYFCFIGYLRYDAEDWTALRDDDATSPTSDVTSVSRTRVCRTVFFRAACYHRIQCPSDSFRVPCSYKSVENKMVKCLVTYRCLTTKYSMHHLHVNWSSI